MDDWALHPPADLAALCAAHYHFLGLWPGFVREKVAGATFTGNRLIAMPFRNHVALVRSQAADVPQLLDHAKTFYGSLKVAPAFQLDRATTPADLPATLLRHGYVKQNEEIWMLCLLAEMGETAPASHITIKQLGPHSPDIWQQAYIDSFNISFRVPTHSHAGFGDSFRGLLPNPNALHFLGLIDGQPVGALTLIHDGRVGGVYNVGTFPAHRGQGVATALLNHTLSVAHALRLERLILQTLHHGPAQPIYERVGFGPHFVRDWYLPEAPKGIWSA